MTGRVDLLITGAVVATPTGLVETTIAATEGRISGLGVPETTEAGTRIDGRGLSVLPGVIDTQVHFREPGLEHKEDLATGTAAAVAGGVTGVFEMPNTKPLTTTPEALADKLRRCAGRAWCDHAFFMGGTATNAETLADWERLPGCSGVKIFMGSSTGDLLTEFDADVRRILAHGRRRISVHAEDEQRLRDRHALVAGGADVERHPDWRDVEAAVRATTRLLGLAEETRRPIHVLHVSTAEELPILAAHKHVASCEATPQHLTLAAPECYRELGSRAQMNPPIRDARHRDALWAAIADGMIDVLGSDHAPHTLEEKGRPYPDSPSGMAGVQTLVPVMLDHVAAGRLTLERLVDLTSAGPARLFGIAAKGRIAPGFDCDLTIVDAKATREITDGWIRSKAGWTPYHGKRVTGWPVATVIRGRVVMRDDDLIGAPSGRPIRFFETRETT